MQKDLFEKAINWTKKKGFKKIKANTDDFESPTALTNQLRDTTVIPDITAQKYGRKSYIEIATKQDNKQALISKWKLFQALASSRGGKLYLLAARGHKAFTERIVKDYKLTNTQVVSL